MRYWRRRSERRRRKQPSGDREMSWGDVRYLIEEICAMSGVHVLRVSPRPQRAHICSSLLRSLVIRRCIRRNVGDDLFKFDCIVDHSSVLLPDLAQLRIRLRYDAIREDCRENVQAQREYPNNEIRNTIQQDTNRTSLLPPPIPQTLLQTNERNTNREQCNLIHLKVLIHRQRDPSAQIDRRTSVPSSPRRRIVVVQDRVPESFVNSVDGEIQSVEE